MALGVDRNASRQLVEFIRTYTDLMERNLGAIRETMSETVDGVMAGIQQISNATDAKKREATEVLVSTYTNPSDDARKAMDSVQTDVDSVFDSAASGKLSTAAGGTVESEELRAKLRRSSGIFSKHMEALGTLDGELQNVLLHMMGMLSRDDVVAQRIEHVAQALQALQASLGYLLVDFEMRCRTEDVERFMRDLKTFMLRSYTTVEEKKLHYQAFPEDRKAS